MYELNKATATQIIKANDFNDLVYQVVSHCELFCWNVINKFTETKFQLF